jgi:carboxyl-terminal processing protease
MVGKLGVVKVKSFTSSTAGDVREATAALLAKGAATVALDLRNNPGGLLDGGVDTARLFLPKGAKVVTVVDAKRVATDFIVDRSLAELAADEPHPGPPIKGFDKVPLVVIVNRKTASSAEVARLNNLHHSLLAAIGYKYRQTSSPFSF